MTCRVDQSCGEAPEHGARLLQSWRQRLHSARRCRHNGGAHRGPEPRRVPGGAQALEMVCRRCAHACCCSLGHAACQEAHTVETACRCCALAWHCSLGQAVCQGQNLPTNCSMGQRSIGHAACQGAASPDDSLQAQAARSPARCASHLLSVSQPSPTQQPRPLDWAGCV